jgi:Fe-S cluster assembly protein SufD
MNRLEKVQKEASREDLQMPESIRTPGRTWTKYPEITELETREPEISIETDGDVEVTTGEEAVEGAAERFMDGIKPSENLLNSLHARNLSSTVLVRAEGEGEVKVKLEAEQPACHHLVVFAEQGSDLTVTEEFRGDSGELLTGFAEVYVGENATVRYGSLESNSSELSYFRRKAVVQDYGRIEWLNAKFSSDLSRTKIESMLVGDSSEAEKLATWYPTEEQHFDTSLHVRHIGENTRCQMDSRAVVDDSSRSVYEGLQKVERTAKDTSSFQDEEVLTLSNKAEVDASPKLMIENPEVEASHAAGAGNIDEAMQHYIETRGLSRQSAERLIVKGFFEPVLEEIDLPELKESIRTEVLSKLER